MRQLLFNLRHLLQQAGEFGGNLYAILFISLTLILYATPLPAQDKQRGSEVFTRAQLEALNAKTLEELLSALPGLARAAEGSEFRAHHLPKWWFS